MTRYFSKEGPWGHGGYLNTNYKQRAPRPLQPPPPTPGHEKGPKPEAGGRGGRIEIMIEMAKTPKTENRKCTCARVLSAPLLTISLPPVGPRPVGEALLRSLCAAMSRKVSFQACIARRFWASTWSSSHLASAVVGCRDLSRACVRVTERVALVPSSHRKSFLGAGGVLDP